MMGGYSVSLRIVGVISKAGEGHLLVIASPRVGFLVAGKDIVLH